MAAIAAPFTSTRSSQADAPASPNTALPKYRLVDRRQSERFWKVDAADSPVLTPRRKKISLLARLHRKKSGKSEKVGAENASAGAENKGVTVSGRVSSPLSDIKNKIDKNGGRRASPATKRAMMRQRREHTATPIHRQFTSFYADRYCAESTRATIFFKKYNITPPAQRWAHEKPISDAEIVEHCRAVRRLVVIRGKKVKQVSVTSTRPTGPVLLDAVCTEGQKMITPCVQVGDKMVLGFSEEVYKRFLFFGNDSPVVPRQTMTLGRAARRATKRASVMLPSNWMQTAKGREEQA
jgi:arsenate reductase-like glutaredoxin family protein